MRTSQISENSHTKSKDLAWKSSQIPKLTRDFVWESSQIPKLPRDLAWERSQIARSYTGIWLKKTAKSLRDKWYKWADKCQGFGTLKNAKSLKKTSFSHRDLAWEDSQIPERQVDKWADKYQRQVERQVPGIWHPEKRQIPEGNQLFTQGFGLRRQPNPWHLSCKWATMPQSGTKTTKSAKNPKEMTGLEPVTNCIKARRSNHWARGEGHLALVFLKYLNAVWQFLRRSPVSSIVFGRTLLVCTRRSCSESKSDTGNDVSFIIAQAQNQQGLRR